jgi:cell division transport system permease protein
MNTMSMRRMIGAGWKNFARGGAVSVATVVIMTVTLGIISSLIFLSALLSFTLDFVRDQVDISVSFVTTASEHDILALKSKIELLPQVKSVTYTTREQVLADFRAFHATDQTILQGLEQLGDNPFGAYLGIKAKDPSQYESISSTLETTPALSAGGASIIDRINYKQNKITIDNLSKAIAVTRSGGLIIVILFALASVMIALATVQLAIYTAKDEIGVMRLVGASNAYIRGPFIVAGVITGILATLAVLIALFPIAWYIGTKTAGLLNGFNIFSYYTSHFFIILIILLVSGVCLGGLASILAIRRYLKV